VVEDQSVYTAADAPRAFWVKFGPLPTRLVRATNQFSFVAIRTAFRGPPMGCPIRFNLAWLKRNAAFRAITCPAALELLPSWQTGFLLGDDYFVQASGRNPITMFKPGGEFANARAFDGREIDRHGGARLCVCDSL